MLYQQGGLDIQASEQTSLECVVKVPVSLFFRTEDVLIWGVFVSEWTVEGINPKMNQSERVGAKSLSYVGSINLHRLDTFGRCAPKHDKEKMQKEDCVKEHAASAPIEAQPAILMTG